MRPFFSDTLVSLPDFTLAHGNSFSNPKLNITNFHLQRTFFVHFCAFVLHDYNTESFRFKDDDEYEYEI